jgi:hypothetical protein
MPLLADRVRELALARAFAGTAGRAADRAVQVRPCGMQCPPGAPGRPSASNTLPGVGIYLGFPLRPWIFDYDRDYRPYYRPAPRTKYLPRYPWYWQHDDHDWKR